ncbi:glycosyltransferase family 9 protein [Bacillus cereus]|uniref:glycosyltransferase family 9 protein n=1 Tax=Bacillus cereus TaxID=1396 RepID=UPI0012FC8F54|nr:glycosyltransferase family 9 protein [Bacillus cereus]
MLEIITSHSNSIIVIEMFSVEAQQSTRIRDVPHLRMNHTTSLECVSLFLKIEEVSSLLEEDFEWKEEPTCAFLVEISQEQQEYKSVGLELLMRQVPRQFGLVGYFAGFRRTYHLLYKELRRYRPLNNTRKPVAVTVWGGYGDAVMMYQQIQLFVNREREKGNEVHIITPYLKMYKIFKAFLKNCNVFCIDIIVNNRLNETLLRSGYYEKIYNLGLLTPQKPPYKHVLDLWSSSLGYDEPSDLLPCADVESPPLPKEVRKILDEKRTLGKKIIGFQFCSEEMEKSWPVEHAKEFLSYCKEFDLCVLNLVPHQYKELEGMIDVGFLPVSGLFSLIAELDIVVGIDSCCCHIAGVLGIPNLTIWGDSYPHQYRPLGDTRYVSYRPLQMNYSLASRDVQPASIPPDLVFQRLTNILDGKIHLQKSRLTIEDSLKGIGIEWVGE